MRRVIFVAVAIWAVASLNLSCGGKGGSNSSNPVEPTSPADSFSTSAAAGEPSDLDWARLGNEFATLGVTSLVETLSGAVSTTGLAALRVGPLGLTAPVANQSWSAAYFCCGSATSYLELGGQILISQNAAGEVTFTQTFNRLVDLTWGIPSSTYTIGFPGDGLTMTSQLATANGSVLQGQEFRLNGSVSYTGSNAVRTVTVNAAFRFPNIEGVGQGVTASGQIGPLTLTGQSMPAATPKRCSRPREGCGALATGNAPCTRYPPC